MSATLPLDTPAGPQEARCQALRADRSGPCGRPLRDPVAVARGIGPDCWERLHGTTSTRRAAAWPAGPEQPALPLDEAYGEHEWRPAGGGAPTVGALFAGFGGLELAVSAALPGAHPVWVSEIDPSASAILATRFPGVPNLGDVTAIDWSAVPRVQIMTGGFPCVDVSLAGARAGLAEGTRSGLWAHMATAIAEIRPALVVIENVRGLLTARGAEPTGELVAAEAAIEAAVSVLAYLDRARDRAVHTGNKEMIRRVDSARVRHLGRHRRAVAAAKRADARIVRAIGAVLGALASIGYDAAWVGLRASDVDAPHERYRVFIAAWPAEDPDGAARGERRLAASGQAESGGSRADACGRGGAPAADAGGSRREGCGHAGPAGWADVARRLAADTSSDGWDEGRAESARIVRGPDASLGCDAAPHPGDDGCAGSPERDRELVAGFDCVDRLDTDGRPVSAVDWGPYAAAIARWEAVTGRPAPAPTEPTGRDGNHRLSPRFTEWLMGLPDGWVTGVPGISRADQLKALGNGVVWQQAAAAVTYLLQFVPAWALEQITGKDVTA